MSLPIPTDNQSYRFPVSVKGIVFRRQHGILLKNERDEWELPGGKLEPTESPKECVVREIEEELGLHVRPTAIVDNGYTQSHPARAVRRQTWCARRCRTDAASAPGKGRRRNSIPRRSFPVDDPLRDVR